MRIESGFAGGLARSSTPTHEQHFGFLLASCERADLRPAPNGVKVYSDDGMYEIPVAPGRIYPNKDAVIDELYQAVFEGLSPYMTASGVRTQWLLRSP